MSNSNDNLKTIKDYYLYIRQFRKQGFYLAFKEMFKSFGWTKRAKLSTQNLYSRDLFSAGKPIYK